MLGFQKLGKTGQRTLFRIFCRTFFVEYSSAKYHSFYEPVRCRSFPVFFPSLSTHFFYFIVWCLHFKSFYASSHFLDLTLSHTHSLSLSLPHTGPETVEVRYLMKQMAKRISESDRTRLTSSAISDCLFGLQGTYVFLILLFLFGLLIDFHIFDYLFSLLVFNIIFSSHSLTACSVYKVRTYGFSLPSLTPTLTTSHSHPPLPLPPLIPLSL